MNFCGYQQRETKFLFLTKSRLVIFLPISQLFLVTKAVYILQQTPLHLWNQSDLFLVDFVHNSLFTLQVQKYLV